MERRLNKKLEVYISTFKNDIRDKTAELGIVPEQANMLLQYVYDYERVSVNKDDFAKRKRVKNIVPFFDRCCAKRASGEQCTRRKKTDAEYCGTHMKGVPHGMVDNQEDAVATSQKIEVWAEDIQGIIYYIDKNNNVYQAEDIVGNKQNPKIIAKYVKTGDVYTIPEFGI
jgi:hypothetical protein